MMEKILNIILMVVEAIAVMVVSYFGIKYLFVAGPIFFNNAWGIIIPSMLSAAYVFLIYQKAKENKKKSITHE